MKFEGRRSVINIARDITRRKAAENAEREQRQLAEALRDTAALLTSTLDLDEVIRRVLDQVTNVVSCDAASIMLVDNGIQARIIGQRGYYAGADMMISETWNINDLTHLSWIIAHSRPLAIPDTQTWDGWRPFPNMEWVRSHVSAPIIADGEIIGFLNLDHSVPYNFNDTDAERLMAFADQASIAIQNARLHEAAQDYAEKLEQNVDQRTRDLIKTNLQLKEQIVERRRIEEELASEHNMLRTLIDNIPDEIYVKDKEGQIVLANRAFTQRTAPRSAAGAPMGLRQTDHLNAVKIDESEAQIHDQEQAVMQSGQAMANEEVRVADEYGNPLWLLTTQIPLRDPQGSIMGLVGVNRNITEIKTAEERLTHIITSAHCLLWYAIVEKNGDRYTWTTHVSDENAAQRFLPVDTTPSRAYFEAFKANIVIEDCDRRDRFADEQLDAGAEAYSLEYRAQRQDGELRWLHEDVHVNRLTSGRFAVVGVCTDVTEAKRAEETLKQTNELLEQRVKERTADLQQEITERIRAEQAERDQRLLAEGLADVSVAIGETLDLEETLDRILDNVSSLVPPFTVAGVLLIEEDVYVRYLRLRLEQDNQRTRPDYSERFPISALPALEQILASQEPVAIRDAHEDPIGAGVAETTYSDIRSFIGVPINAQSRIIGFVAIGSEVPGQFTVEHAQRILAFCNQAGVAIQNARLFREVKTLAGELQQRVDERTAELETERAQLNTILDNMTEGVIYYDVEGRIRYTNRSLTRMTGYDASEWLAAGSRWPGQLLDEVAQRKLTKSFQRSLFRDGIWQSDLRIFNRTGAIVDVKLVMTLITGPDGQAAGAVTVLRDVSAEKRLEAQKARFIATASHELRTPLANLKTRLYLIDKQPEKSDEHLEIVSFETNRMKSLVDELLDVSRFEHGLITLNYSQFVLQELIRLIVKAQMPRAEEKSIRLATRLAREMIILEGDRLRIEQVITNLVNNAINYTLEGGSIMVSVEARRDESADLSSAVIRIKDSGVGISEEVLPHIFQPFFRVDDHESGMGLGLSIAKEIIEMHDGEISVESEVDNGTRFTIVLPLRAGE